MDRPSQSKAMKIGTDGSSKQGRNCASADGGYKGSIAVNGYGNVSVPQSRKMG